MGLTSIELVAALGAALIVAALLVSAYRTHNVRTQVAAGVAAAANAETFVTHAFQTSGEPPSDAGATGLAPESSAARLLDRISIVDGRIDLVFAYGADRAIAGRMLPLTPFETADLEIVWICGNRLPGPGLQPLGFSDGGRQAVQTIATIEPRYLPRHCR